MARVKLTKREMKVCLKLLHFLFLHTHIVLFQLRSNVLVIFCHKLRLTWPTVCELCGQSLPGSGGRPLPHLISGLWVLDDLPAGGGVAHVGGAPSAARPRQEAKAAPNRVEKTDIWGQICSRGLQLNIVQDWRRSQHSDSVSRERQREIWCLLCYVVAFALHLMRVWVQNASVVRN